jgi:hypothetical protein
MRCALGGQQLWNAMMPCKRSKLMKDGCIPSQDPSLLHCKRHGRIQDNSCPGKAYNNKQRGMKPPKFVHGETGYSDGTSRVVARPTHPCTLAASSIGVLSLTLSPSPLIVLATSSPLLLLLMHESSMSLQYPPTSALSRGCTLLYAANRSSLLDMALWTMAKVTSFNLRLQFDMRLLQHPLKSSGLLSGGTSVQALTPHIYERREGMQRAVAAAIAIGNGVRQRAVWQRQSVAACGGVQRRAADNGELLSEVGRDEKSCR